MIFQLLGSKYLKIWFVYLTKKPSNQLTKQTKLNKKRTLYNFQNSQKLTAEATVDKDRVYFPLYEPTSGTNACKTGKAILTAYDSKCGNSVLNVNLGTGVLSKVVKQDDNLYIGIAGEANKNISGFTSKDNLITGKSKAKDTGIEVQLEKWIENY